MSGLTQNSRFVDILKVLELDKHVQFEKVSEFYAVLSDKGEFVFPHGFEAATRALIKEGDKVLVFGPVG